MRKSPPPPPRPGGVRRRHRWAVVPLTVTALAVTGAAALPANAAPAADGSLFTGWTADQGGRGIVLDLEGPGERDLVTVAWRDTAAAAVRAGCVLVVEAPAGTGWAEVGRAALAETESGNRDVALPATAADRLRVGLANCQDAQLTPLAQRITVRTSSQRQAPVRTNFDNEPLGGNGGPYLWDSDGAVSVAVPGGGTNSRALAVRRAADGEPSSSWTWFPRSEKVEVTYRMRVDDPAAQAVVGLRERKPNVRESDTQSIMSVGFQNGRIYAWGDGERTDLGAYQAGTFYTVKITLRPGTGPGKGTFAVDLQDPAVGPDLRRVASGLPVRPSTAPSVNSVIVANLGGAEAVWLDDVSVVTTTEAAQRRVFEGPFDTAPLRRVGTLAPPPQQDNSGFASSTFSIGTETLDRDFADISSYIGELRNLGIGSARLQAGWNRLEPGGKGEFVWDELDAEVNALRQAGIKPWIELSYGNFFVPGGGGVGLGGPLPTAEGLPKWRAFVKAAVSRYKDRVSTWSVWNEPSNDPNNSGAEYAALVTATVQEIDAEQKDAEVIAGNTAAISEPEFIREALTALRDTPATPATPAVPVPPATPTALDLVDLWGFHGYLPNPDRNYTGVDSVPELRKIVDEFAPRIQLIQTENGNHSVYSGNFAQADFNWTETTQAKWDTRRMLGDNARGLRTNVFTAADLRYAFTPRTVTWNPKGLIQVDADKRAVRNKAAFRAVQVVATLFNNATLVRNPDALVRPPAQSNVSAFGYRKAGSGEVAVSYWRNDTVPNDSNGTLGFVDLTVPASAGQEFVVVDVSNGDVYQVPPNRVTSGADGTTVRVDVADGPFVLTVPSAVAALQQG